MAGRKAESGTRRRQSANGRKPHAEEAPVVAPTAGAFETSASELSAYFNCPAKYRFMKEWRPLQTSVELQDGIDAHALLAGKPAPTASARAQWFAARLTRAGQQYKLVPGRREVYQRVQWQGFVLKRIIDQYAYDHLTPVLIDWKTGTWPWDAIDGIYPKALTFQSAIYLLPPSLPRAAAPFKKWPERIDFVTAPEKGTVTPFAVYRDEDDERNLLQAVEQVAEARRFPRNRGFNCKYCDFFWKCFGIEQESGKHYERRTSFVPLEEL